MPRLTREQQRLQTVRKLRGAALREVAQTGFSAATIDRITESAGFSRGAFYSNFRSKEELVLALLEQDNGDEMVAWRDLIRDAPDMDTMYARMAERFAAYISKTDWSLFFLEVQLHAKRNPAFGARYREHMKKTDERVRELLELLFARAQCFAPADIDLLALSLRNYSTVLSMQMCWEDERVQAQQMASLVVLYLKGMVALGTQKNAVVQTAPDQ